MVPAENLSKQHHLHHGGGGSFYGCCGSGYRTEESFGVMSRVNGYDSYYSEACLGSDLGTANNPMAEDESRTNSLNNETTGSSSKENNNSQEEIRDEGNWLQLGIGGQADHNKHDDVVQGGPSPTAPPPRRGGLIELDLLTGGSSQQVMRPPLGAPIFNMPEFRAPSSTFNTSLFFHQHLQQAQLGSSSTTSFPHHGDHRHHQISWAFRPILAQNIAAAAASSSSSSSSSSLAPLGSYFARVPFQVQSGMMQADVAGPSSDIRIIDPPSTTPHNSGIWFMLQASQNQ